MPWPKAPSSPACITAAASRLTPSDGGRVMFLLRAASSLLQTHLSSPQAVQAVTCLLFSCWAPRHSTLAALHIGHTLLPGPSSCCSLTCLCLSSKVMWSEAFRDPTQHFLGLSDSASLSPLLVAPHIVCVYFLFPQGCKLWDELCLSGCSST